jgi:hypothetical protein
MVFFCCQLFSSRTGQFVVARFAIVFGYAPRRLDPTLCLKSIKSGIERTLFDTQDIFRHLLDPVRDRQPMSCIVLERFKDQHVERSVNEVGFLFCHKGLVDLDSLGERIVHFFPRLSRGECRRVGCTDLVEAARPRRACIMSQAPGASTSTTAAVSLSQDRFVKLVPTVQIVQVYRVLRR